MSRCFACDSQLPGGEGYDPPTDRSYCSTCFEPTIEEQLRQVSLDVTKDGPDELMKAILELAGETYEDTVSIETFREQEEE